MIARATATYRCDLFDELGLFATYDDAEGAAFDAIEPGIWAGPDRTINADRKPGETLNLRDARRRVVGWRRQARRDRLAGGVCDRVVLSLFDRTGNIIRPWLEAGYTCYGIDLDDDCGAWPVDVHDMTAQFLIDHGIDMVDVVLAQPPCTDFASSGARWFADKDADGRTEASVSLVHQTLAVIGWLRPKVWALENPIGRIGRMTGMPRPRLRFNPCCYGDPYTKRTQLWGDFNADLPLARVDPIEGSRMHRLRGDVPAQKKARSVTPLGFAFAFYMANRDYSDRWDDRVRANMADPALAGSVKGVA